MKKRLFDQVVLLCPFLFAVWLSIMFPVLGIRSLAPYTVASLDRLLM